MQFDEEVDTRLRQTVLGDESLLHKFTDAAGDLAVNLVVGAIILALTLVMCGDQDILTPLAQGPQGAGSDVIARLIPNAELCLLEGVGHTNLMEVPELSVEIVTAFLRRVSTQN